MPLHSDDRALFERLLSSSRRAHDGHVRAYYDALASYQGGADDLVARALSLILSPSFGTSRRADDALERFIRDFERPELVRAAAATLTSRWQARAGGSPLTGVTARRALRLARTCARAPAGDRFAWAWLARPEGLPEAARIARGADLGLDTLDPVLPELLAGALDDDEVALVESLLLHASWIARRVLVNQIGGPEHTCLLPALALASSSANPTTALALVGALRRIGHPAAEHPLVTILLKPDPGPDVVILEAMAELGTATYLQTLSDFAADAADPKIRAAALGAVDAIVERASLGGGALTLVDNGELTGALTPSAAGAGALSAPGQSSGGAREGHPSAPEVGARVEPPASPRARVAPNDPFHALVRRRVDEGGALTTEASQQLAQRSWLRLAPAPRRVPRFFALTDSPFLTSTAGGLGALLLLSAYAGPILLYMAFFFAGPYILVALISTWRSSIAAPLRHARLLRRGLPTLGQLVRYDQARQGYVVAFVTDDNRRVESLVDAVEGDSRLRQPLQPLLYDPGSHEADLFALIEGVELAPDGQLAPRRSAVVYRNMSLTFLLAGALSMALSLLL